MSFSSAHCGSLPEEKHIYTLVSSHIFVLGSVLGLHNISVQIIMRWAFQLFDPCDEQDDLHPLPQTEWRRESWGAQRRWAFSRLQAFWHIAQHLAAAAKGRTEFRETLQQLLTLSTAAGHQVQKFLQEFSFVSRHASAICKESEETKCGAQRQKTFHALFGENLKDWF